MFIAFWLQNVCCFNLLLGVIANLLVVVFGQWGPTIEILVFTLRGPAWPACPIHALEIQFNISIPKVRLFLN